MANNNVIGQFADETGEIVQEVATDVKDALGEMIEQGVQSVSDPQMTPQQMQQKQQEDQKKEVDRQKQLAYQRRYIADLTANQQRVRMENKQKEQQRLQAQQQEQQVVEIKKEEKKKEPVNPAVAYAGKAEFKRGVGG